MIPLESWSHPGIGSLTLADLPFEGPDAIAELLTELDLPAAGHWSIVDTHGAEGYRIQADEDGLIVEGGELGLKWAVQTLRQLVHDGQIDQVEITDAPRYAWRGSLLDVARWHHPIEFLHRYVDLMALHKLNRLHLHLTDDQGWRFEVKRYPRLTEVGGYRAESMEGHFYEGRYDGRRHGGSYTQEQLKNLVAYARRRGVEIMPEIDLPGHTQAAVAAYPELGNDPSREVAVSTKWGIHDIVLNTDEATVEFFQHVLDELIEVFPFEYVHLGGDEVRSQEWRDNPAVAARAAELGLSNVDDLLGWWIGRLQQHLAHHGRRTAVWDELLDVAIPLSVAERAGATDAAPNPAAPNRALDAPALLFFGWRDVTKAPQARAAGFEAVSCPQAHAYFDWAESDRADEPLAIARTVSLEDAYSFEPGDVTGIQGNLWTEYLPTPDLVEYRAFPRLAALAEVAWGKSDFTDFSERLPGHLELLRKLKVNYRPL